MKYRRIIYSFQSLKFSDIVQLVRFPNLLIIALTQYFTAICLIGQYDSAMTYLSDVRLFLLMLSTLFIAAGGYVINDYYDIKIDYLNRPNRVLVGDAMKRRVALVLHWGFSVTGIALGALLGIYILLVDIVVVFLLWLYSNQLKRMPLIGNIIIAAMTSTSMLVLLLIYDDHYRLVIVYAVFAFFMNLIREILKDMEDLKGDRAFGCKTLPIIWGIRKSKFFIYALMIIFITLLTWLIIRENNSFLKIYFVILVIPGSFIVHKLIKSDTVRDFNQLSSYSKLIMLSGILSMVFFKLIIQ